MTNKKRRQKRELKRLQRKVEATTPPASGIAEFVCDCLIEAAAPPADGETQKRPTFEIDAYQGGMMTVAYWPYPVVIDIAGMSANPRTPILYRHDAGQVLGQSESIEADKRVRLTGIITGEDEVTENVLTHARNGFTWAASVGVRAIAGHVREIVGGAKFTANGQTFTGPAHLLEKSELREVSIVSIGADRNAATSIAAAATDERVNEMDFETWVKAKGFDPETLTDGQRATLLAAFNGADAGEDEDPSETTANTPTGTDAAKVNAELSANYDRIAKIRKIAEADHPEICAEAIKNGWSPEATELKVLRAEQARGPRAPSILTGAGGDVPRAKVLEAAACQSIGLASVEKSFDDKTLQAAHSAFRGRIGLQRLIAECARAAGWDRLYFEDDRQGCLNAAFSSAAIGGILSNVANKLLLESYNAVSQKWRKLCRPRPVSDLKEHKTYRLGASGTYDEVTDAGELKHGSLTESEFTNQPKTYGRLLALTRKDLINDDLGALQRLLSILGGDSARTISLKFFAEFMDNATFFTTANKNYASGAATALGWPAVAVALQMFRDQTDENGNPIDYEPDLIIVPTALEAMSKSIHTSEGTRDTTASKKDGTANIYRGMFEPVVVPHLSNTNLTGASSLKWYLGSSMLPMMDIAFLNGAEAPTIESVDAPSNVLGIHLRAYHDFGVGKLDHRGGVAMKGEA